MKAQNHRYFHKQFTYSSQHCKTIQATAATQNYVKSLDTLYSSLLYKDMYCN